jgi:hypothetical protein
VIDLSTKMMLFSLHVHVLCMFVGEVVVMPRGLDQLDLSRGYFGPSIVPTPSTMCANA